MPVTIRRNTVLRPDAPPDNPGLPIRAEEPGVWQSLADMYATGFWGAAKDEIEESWLFHERESGFDGLDHIPEGYEQFADAFMWAGSASQVEAIRANIDDMQERQARLAQNGWGENLFYGLVAGIFDPVNFIAGPTLKGVGFVKGALKGGTAFGTINAAQETLRNRWDPTVTDTETMINVGFGYGVAGLISGGIGRFTRPGARTGPATLDRTTRERAEAAGDSLARVIALSEGRPVTERIDLDGQGVRIVDGPTGRADARGNPVMAFFRSKEAFLEAKRRQDEELAASLRVVPENRFTVTRVDEQGNPVDELDVDVTDQPGEVGAVDVDDILARPRAEGEEEAAIPFGADEAEARKTSVEDEFEDTVFVDSEAVMAAYERKVWTQPRTPGVEPLPENAFGSAEEWFNFVVRHELHHSRTKRLEGESTADYENRINRLAYEETAADRLAPSPTDSLPERALLWPLPVATMMRLVGRHREAHQLLNGIGGDHATMTVNAREGMPVTPGGSVFQKSLRWLNNYGRTKLAASLAYVQYVKGTAPERPSTVMLQASLAAIPKVGAAAKQGKLTRAQFNAYVGRAVHDDGPFEMFGRPLAEEDMKLVRMAAEAARRELDAFREVAQSLGMFDAQKRLGHEIAWRKAAVERNDKRLEAVKRGPLRKTIEAEQAARRAEIEELEAELAAWNENPIVPPHEDHYWPRVFDIGAIRDRYDDFVALVAESFGGTPEAFTRARKVADGIIGDGGDLTQFGMGSPRHLRGRQIPLSNKELADFIVHDVDLVMGLYTRRMGAAIEMTRKYGSTHLDDRIDALRAQLLDEGKDAKTVAKVVQEMEDVRDRVLGRLHTKDPLSWDNRVARVIKQFGNTVLLGKGIAAQLVDVARTVAVEGYGTTFQAMLKVWDDRYNVLDKGRYAKAAGEGFDLIQARLSAMLVENDSALLVTQQTRFEGALARMQPAFFVANLMSPFTVAWKDFTSLMSSHMLIAESKQLAAAIRSGKTLTSLSPAERKVMARLASFGIDVRTAQAIADMPVEQASGGNLWLANLDAWEGRKGEQAREAFMAALSGTLRSSVVTPGPLQRHTIMDGVFRWKGKRVEAPLLSLPFQLMSFGMAGSAKITHSILSGRDRNRMVTVLSLLAGGYVAARLSAFAGGQDWEQLDWQEKTYRMIDRAGIGGYLSDVARRIEDLSGYGMETAMTGDNYGSDLVSSKVGAVGGPALGVAAGMVEAFVSDSPDLELRRRAAMVRRAVPWSGLIWWDDAMKDLTNLVVEEAEGEDLPVVGEDLE